MRTVYHSDILQGTDEWIEARRGLITASEMHLIMTLGGKAAANPKERAHLNELAAQRITGHVEEAYISGDMLRGTDDEVEARAAYSAAFAPVQECGFVTGEWPMDKLRIGYSPDGLVGSDGLIECKSRRQRYQIATILANEMPEEYELQVQCGLLVTGRAWCDFVSYSAGMPMVVIRQTPKPAVHTANLGAVRKAEGVIAEKVANYGILLPTRRTVPTERRIADGTWRPS